MCKVSNKLDKAVGWITSGQFTEEELRVLFEKLSVQIDKVNNTLDKVNNMFEWTPLANLTASEGGGRSADFISFDDVVNNIPTRKENTMYDSPRCKAAVATAAPVVNFNAGESEIETQRNYLRNRLDTLFWKKHDEIHHFFEDVDVPKTKDELLRRLRDGLYTIDENLVDKDGTLRPYYTTAAISWRLRPVDAEAMDAAHAALSDQNQKTRDTIAIFPADKGLEALRAFEAWMPEGVTAQ